MNKCKLSRYVSYLERKRTMGGLPVVLKLRRPHVLSGYADNKRVQQWLRD